MLTVKTCLAKSRISGIGLFADEFIPRGTLMWYTNPTLDVLITDSFFATLTPIEKEFAYKYFVKEKSGWRVIGDDARFINHSRSPNMSPPDHRDENEKDYSVVNINIGDEITYDYRNFEQDPIIKENWI